jgi:hypothetical protein
MRATIKHKLGTLIVLNASSKEEVLAKLKAKFSSLPACRNWQDVGLEHDLEAWLSILETGKTIENELQNKVITIG